MYYSLSLSICILVFEGRFVGYVYWWEFVCELPETFHSSYSFCCMFWERDEWPSLRSSESLSVPSLCSLLTWPPFIFDLSGSSLVLVFYASSSSSFSLLIHHFHFTPYSVLTVTSFSGLILSSCHHYTSRHRFGFFLHCIIFVTMFTVGIFRSMAHDIFYICCILYMRAWVLIIGYLGLVSLHFYHPITLAFVTSWVLRPPWGHDITHCVW